MTTPRIRHIAARPMTKVLNNNEKLCSMGDLGKVDKMEKTEKIHLACHQLDETNTKAEYVVNFGPGDSRNKTGVIQGELALQRADLTGLHKALEQALQSGNMRPHITTDAKYLYMVDRFRSKWKSLGWTYVNGAELLNRKQIVLVDTLCEKFERVRIELVPGPRYTPGSSGF